MIATFDRASRRFPLLAAALTLLVGCATLTDARKGGAGGASAGGDAAVPADTQPTDADLRAEFREAEPVEEPDPETKAALAALEKQLPELSFDAAPLGEVIDFLRDVTGVNLFVNWKALEAAGVDRKAPVSVRLRNVQAGKALTVILESIRPEMTLLGYAVDKGVVTVSTADDLPRELVTRVYDIRDLTAVVRDAGEPPALNPPDGEESGNGEGEGGGLWGEEEESQEEGAEPTPHEVAAEIMDLVTETVQPDTWRDNGGPDGAIRLLNGQLVVTHTPDAHRQVAQLLGQLRETRGVQVTVEQRLIELPAEAVAAAEKEMGVKLREGAGATPLNDSQVNDLLRATQGEREARLMIAPRVTVFNGQRAYVILNEEKPYVSGITVVRTKEGETRYEPRHGTARAGLVFDVAATVSADRGYVTLTLRPTVSDLLGFRRVPFEGAPADAGVFTQEPVLNTMRMTTTVSVPHDRSLLVAGFRGAEGAGGAGGEPAGAAADNIAEPRLPAAGPGRHLFLLVKASVLERGRKPGAAAPAKGEGSRN